MRVPCGKGIAVQFLLSLLADYLFKRLFYEMLIVLCIVRFFRGFFYGRGKGKRKRGKQCSQKKQCSQTEISEKGNVSIVITGRACNAMTKLSEFHNWEIEALSSKMPGLIFSKTY